MLQIAICDDDRADMDALKAVLEKVMDKYSIRYRIETYDSGEELLDASSVFQLIFLDIKMDECNGIEIGKKIYRRYRTKIIFQTYFEKYLNDAVNKSHAFAYLKKPVNEEVLEEQIREFFAVQDNVQAAWMEFRHIRYQTPEGEVTKEMVRLPVRDIICIESRQQEKATKITTERGTFTCAETIGALEKRMKHFGFEICCKGILVNLDMVNQVKNSCVLLKDGGSKPLSQRRAVRFRESLNEFVHDSFLWNHG